MSAYAAGPARHVRLIALNSNAIRVAVAFVVLCLIAGGTFLAGERQGDRTTVLTGMAYTGTNEATVTVAGWSYGISGNVTWLVSAAQAGPYCERSVPVCSGRKANGARR